METEDKYYYNDGSVLNYFDKTKILYRSNGLPIIEYVDGSVCIDNSIEESTDKHICIIDSSGNKFWYCNGVPHRSFKDDAKDNTPGKKTTKDYAAIEWIDGSRQWFLQGEEVTEESYKLLLDAYDFNQVCDL